MTTAPKLSPTPDAGSGGPGFPFTYFLRRAIEGALGANGPPQFSDAERRRLAELGYKFVPTGKGPAVFRSPDGQLIRDPAKLHELARVPSSPPSSLPLPGAAAAPSQPVPTKSTPRNLPPKNSSSPQPSSPLPGPWRPPATDEEWSQWYEDSGLPDPESGDTSSAPRPSWGWQSFVGPLPGVEEASIIRTTGARVLGRIVLGTLGGILSGVLFPSTTSSTDTWPGTQRPRGPLKRPRIRVPSMPDPIPQYWPAPKVPSEPQTQPRPRVRPSIDPRNYPIGEPYVGPIELPAPRPIPVPAPTPMPTSPRWFDPLEIIVPLLLAQPRPGTTPRYSFPTPQPGQPGDQLVEIPNPLTAGLEQPLPYPSANDRCDCTKTRKRKKREKSCSNPIVSKRKRTRDGRMFQTITREIKCPVSSRKKRP